MRLETRLAAGRPGRDARDPVTGPERRDEPESPAHRGLNKVSFTGEHRTAQKIMAAASLNLKRCSFECGGRSPHIVFADAGLGTAPGVATHGAFRSTGQSCSPASRLFVERARCEHSCQQMAERARRIRIGMPFHETTHIGPSGLGRATRQDASATSRSAIRRPGTGPYPHDLPGDGTLSLAERVSLAERARHRGADRVRLGPPSQGPSQHVGPLDIKSLEPSRRLNDAPEASPIDEGSAQDFSSLGSRWWARQDSNLRQRRYERRVLTAELRARTPYCRETGRNQGARSPAAARTPCRAGPRRAAPVSLLFPAEQGIQPARSCLAGQTARASPARRPSRRRVSPEPQSTSTAWPPWRTTWAGP